MQFRHFKNLKDSFFHPAGRRNVMMSIGGNIAGFSAVPTALGVGAGLLAFSLAGGLAVPLLVGGAVALAGAAVTFAGILRAGLGKRKDTALAYPFLAGKILGDAIGWSAYSLLHPVETYNEIANGQDKKAYGEMPPPAVQVQQPALQDKNLKNSFTQALENTPLQKATAPDVKKDAPKP